MRNLTTFAATALVIFAIGQALAQPAKSAELPAATVGKGQALVLRQAQDEGFSALQR